MARQAFFALGVANSILLILIFLLRGSHLGFIESYGWVYLLLALPAIYVMSLVGSEQRSAQYRIFLGIFLAFLLLEGALDFVWEVPFRDDWKLLTPYLVLYYGMNYGFIVMPWKASRNQGILMLGLFIFQLGANFSTH